MFNIVYNISFRCFYENGNKTQHRQALTIDQIPRWIEAYKFTHPDCTSISVCVYFENTAE